MLEVKKNVNGFDEFRGLNRLNRPPVFAWSKMSHTEQKKRDLSKSSKKNEK
jgi:hypothetical protein